MMVKVLFMGAVSYDAEYSVKPLQIRLKIDAGGFGGMQDRFDHKCMCCCPYLLLSSAVYRV